MLYDMLCNVRYAGPQAGRSKISWYALRDYAQETEGKSSSTGKYALCNAMPEYWPENA